MTYNERVQAIAEEMAKHHNDMCDAFDADEAKVHTGYCDKFARIAIEYMAEAARKAWINGLGDGKPIKWNCGPHLNKYLKEQGLIPDNAQEPSFDPDKEVKTISVSSKMFDNGQEGEKL